MNKYKIWRELRIKNKEIEMYLKVSAVASALSSGLLLLFLPLVVGLLFPILNTLQHYKNQQKTKNQKIKK